VLIIMVAAGGAIGTWLRYRVTAAVHARAGNAFPWGTLAVNVSGSFALGCMLPALMDTAADSALRAFLTVGCASAFTTYSTFAYEAAVMITERRHAHAVLYAAASVGLGLTAVAAGLFIGELVA
jgi:fluoride exporter